MNDDELFTPVDYRVELSEIAVGQAPIEDDYADDEPDTLIYYSSYDLQSSNFILWVSITAQ